MDQEIFEIIDRNLMLDMPFAEEAKRDTAKEIAGYFNQYIEWKDREYYFVAGLYFEKAEADTPFHNRPRYTFDALYKYYCDKVLNLKQK